MVSSPRHLSHIAIVLLLLSSIFFITSPCFGESKKNETAASLQEMYNQAKFYYNHLETIEAMGQQRKLWLKSSSNFRKIYLANPKSELASASLFMLGKIYLRMFEIFNQSKDLKESVGYYRDCAVLFPRHRLADDALFVLGSIASEKYHDKSKAASYYTNIIEKYPNGDMHPLAAKELKLLSSKYDIALPKTMYDGSTHRKLTNVLPVKYWSSSDYSRVIINASGPVTYSAQLIEKVGNMPRRLYIDFKGSYIAPKYRSPVPIKDGLLKQIRTGQNDPETVRVVLDIESISAYKIFSLPDPFRVVIDVRGDKPNSLPETNQPAHSLDKPSITDDQIVTLKQTKKLKPRQPQGQSQQANFRIDKDYSLAQQLGLGVKTIVLDPGHGGRDPGAIANGLKEKDVVLNLAKRLKPVLEESLHCKVVLTRENDTYLSLEERTAIANGNNADLFISLHINAHPESSANGIETYFLNLTANREAMRVAAYENATSELQMSDLEGVLADIMKNSKIKESSRLAKNVHHTLVGGLSSQGKPLKDLGVKQAPFYVLIGAEMPSILLETAFISNPQEARLLATANFLNDIAVMVSKGISLYINSNTARLIN